MRRVTRRLSMLLVGVALGTAVFFTSPAEAWYNYHPCRSYVSWRYSLTCESRFSSTSPVTIFTAVAPGYGNSVWFNYAKVRGFSRTNSLYGGYYTGYDRSGRRWYQRFFICRSNHSSGAYCTWA